MTLFWIICAVLLIVALLFVALPLWRARGNNNDVLRDAANLEILRDQSVELDSDLRNGLLTQDAYEQGQRELQSRLLEEVETSEKTVKLAHNPAKLLALVLTVLIPLFSVPLYLTLGNTNAIRVASSPVGMTHETMLQELEKRVAREPDDPNSLVELARAYVELERYPEALRAYQKLSVMVPDIAQVWVEYAQVHAMNNGGSLRGEPARLIEKALALDADNGWALGMSGSAAMESGDYVTAITHWQKLVDLLPPDNPEIPSIREAIQQARMLLGEQEGGKEKLAKLPAAKARSAEGKAAPGAISGKVSLSPALAGKVSPTDTVFILARPVSGSKMPLAILRKQVKDLPLQFVLDDSSAMQPQFKLSGYEQVVVVARVSKSGNAMSEPGDLQGMKPNVKTGSKGVNLVIDTVVD